MIRKASDNAKELIRRFEGLRLQAYKCPAGVWTIGYGHTAGVHAGQLINIAKAESLLNDDVKVCEDVVNRLVKSEINQNQFDALISFVFNFGENKFKGYGILKMINENPNSEAIKKEWLRFIYSAGKPSSGLKKRREAEALLYFSTKN